MLYYNQILDSILLSTGFLSIRKGLMHLSFWVKKTNIICGQFWHVLSKTYVHKQKKYLNKPTQLRISSWRWMEIKQADKKIDFKIW